MVWNGGKLILEITGKCSGMKWRQVDNGDQRQLLGMQVRIRTNSLKFEFAPNSHEFVDPSEFEFATSNSNFSRISLNQPDRENP